jgi:hypothetical protein
MWKMTKVVDRDGMTFRMSGHLEAQHLVEIQKALAEKGMDENVVLDLGGVTVATQEAVRFLAHFGVNRIRIDRHKCPTYIRVWIAQERKAMRRRESESAGQVHT